MVHNDLKVRMATNSFVIPKGPDRRCMEERRGVEILVKHIRVSRTSWERPLIGVVKINTDGSLRYNKGTWGLP